MWRTSLFVLLLAFSASATAQDFDYSYFSLGYGNIDFDGVSDDGDGFTLGGSYALTDKLHAFAGYDDAELNSVADVTRWRAGIGYNTSMSGTIDMFARLSYESLEFDVPLVGTDDDGYGLSVGARFKAGNQIELSAAVKYVDYGDLGDDTGLEVGVLYNFNDTWTAGLTSEWSDDISTYTLGGRFYFGQ